MPKQEEPKEFDVRKQVPESDVAYREMKDNVYKDTERFVFGYNQVRQYESSLRNYETLVEDSAELRYLLSTMPDQETEEALRYKEMIAKNEELAKTEDVQKGEKLRNAFRTALENFSGLRQIEGREERTEFIFSEFREMFSAKELEPILEKEFGDDLAAFSLSALYERIIDGSVSDELLYLAARHHVALMRERQGRLDRISGEAAAEFREQVTEKIKNGFLPPVAAECLPRATLSSVFLRDRLYDMSSGTVGHSTGFGRFTVYSDQVAPEKIRNLKATLFHEMTHELSGKAVNVRSQKIGKSSRFEYAYPRKMGLVLNKPGESYHPYEWLNEAVTEWVALELSGYKDEQTTGSYKGSNSYPEERKELDRLFGLGLEKDLVLLAYFEDIKSGQPASERGEHYTKLVQRINELEGENGFTKLEYQHIAREARKALIARSVYPEESINEEMQVFQGALRCDVELVVGIHKPKIMTKQKYVCYFGVHGKKGKEAQEYIQQELEVLGKSFAEIEKQFGNRIEISLVGPKEVPAST